MICSTGQTEVGSPGGHFIRQVPRHNAANMATATDEPPRLSLSVLLFPFYCIFIFFFPCLNSLSRQSFSVCVSPCQKTLTRQKTLLVVVLNFLKKENLRFLSVMRISACGQERSESVDVSFVVVLQIRVKSVLQTSWHSQSILRHA